MNQKGTLNKFKKRRRFLIKGDISIISKHNFRLKESQWKMIKTWLIKNFALKGISQDILLYDMVQFDKSFLATKKGILVRMGKGKGKFDYKYIRLRQSQSLIEFKILTNVNINLRILNWILNELKNKFPKILIKSLGPF